MYERLLPVWLLIKYQQSQPKMNFKQQIIRNNLNRRSVPRRTLVAHGADVHLRMELRMHKDVPLR